MGSLLVLSPYRMEVIPSLLYVTCCPHRFFFAEMHSNQIPPNTLPEPLLHANPIRNTRMGEPSNSQPTLPPASPHPPKPSVNQTRSSCDHSRPFPNPSNPSRNLSHCSPRPCSPPTSSSQTTELTPANPVQTRPKVIRKPRGITKKGFKQSMGLHVNEVSKHAYNRFKVGNISLLYSFAKCPLFQDRVRTKMKEKGEGLWVNWDDVPKSYKDWLVNQVSTSTLFL